MSYYKDLDNDHYAVLESDASWREYDNAQKEELYRKAKNALVGERVTCPTCTKPFIKTSYQQAFCSNKGSGNCKDTYWNSANEKRRERAKKFNA
jgi:hypothetical protein